MKSNCSYQNFEELEISELLEMLVTHTSNYTKMLSEGASGDDFEACRNTINQLQGVIKSRGNNSTTSTSDQGNLNSDVSYKHTRQTNS